MIALQEKIIKRYLINEFILYIYYIYTYEITIVL